MQIGEVYAVIHNKRHFNTCLYFISRDFFRDRYPIKLIVASLNSEILKTRGLQSRRNVTILFYNGPQFFTQLVNLYLIEAGKIM